MARLICGGRVSLLVGFASAALSLLILSLIHISMCIRDSYRGDIMEALTKVLHRIEGAYALGIICADCPDRLIAARKDSPLILGYGEGCHFLALSLIHI